MEQRKAVLDSEDWSNDTPADLRSDEAALEPKNLASMFKIMAFGSKYWGGVGALLIMLTMILVLIVVATNETIYDAVRNWVIEAVAALVALDGTSFISLTWKPLAVLAVTGAAYFTFVKIFLHRKDTIHAWGLAILILFLATLNVKMGVELINWSGDFWESVKNKEADKLIPGLVLFAQLAFTSIIAGTYRIFFSQMLQVRWRTWLTRNFATRYLSDNRFYDLEQQRSQDNPDQRIADDLDGFTSQSISLFFGFYLASLSVYEYSKALLKISGDIDFELMGHSFHIPDYMFWTVIVYTIIGSTVIHLIGRRLVKINVLSQKFNANFRYHLIRGREYAEGISFLKGDEHHIRTARHLFGIIRANWFNLMWRIKFLGFSSSIYGQAGIIFPVVVAVPRYFSGAMNFGGIMQVIRAFGELRESLSWFIENYTTIADLRASSTRLFLLETAMNNADILHKKSQLHVSSHSGQGVALTHVSLSRPQMDDAGNIQEKAQVLGLDWQIAPGQRWMVSGASGSGKSTILRAIAGLWPYGKGQVNLPSNGKVLFLPQRPYFPIADLRAALAYPSAPDAYSDALYQTALERTQLGSLSGRLAEVANWGQMLSGGEQQRLAFARVFLQKPDYLFLDEATASLDIENEKLLYASLLEFLPSVTLVSISHHEQLKQYHDHQLQLLPEAAGGYKAKMSAL